MYVLGNDIISDEPLQGAATAPLQLQEEAEWQEVIEPPLIDKQSETPAPATTPSKLPLKPASGNTPFKSSVISEKQHLHILEETFGSDHVLHNHVLFVRKFQQEDSFVC